MGFLKLPGWIAIATGVLQFAIVVAGTIFGTFAGHVTAGNEYNRQRNYLLQQQKSALAQQQQLQDDRNQIQREMMLLAQEMQQLIQKYDLKNEVPAAQPPQQPIPHVQPQQPIPHVQPREKTGREQYEERKARYEVLEERWHEVNQALTVVASHLDEIANQIAQLPWPISKVPAAFLTSITWSSMASAGTPFVIAYIAWVLGIVMACVGFIWLALVQRVFLAPPDCYLRTST